MRANTTSIYADYIEGKYRTTARIFYSHQASGISHHIKILH